MAKKMLRKQRIAIQKLEERVLFDAAGAAEIVDAAAEGGFIQRALLGIFLQKGADVFGTRQDCSPSSL